MIKNFSGNYGYFEEKYERWKLSLPALRPKTRRVYPLPEGHKRIFLGRWTGAGKADSQAARLLQAREKQFFVTQLSISAITRSHFRGNSSSAGNGNYNCPVLLVSRISHLVFVFSSRLGSVPNCDFRRIRCSAISRGQHCYSSCTAKVVVPHLLYAGIVHSG